MSDAPTTCTRCGRTLTSPAAWAGAAPPSSARPPPPPSLVKPDTLAKAVEDIEDGALIDTRRTTSIGRRIYAVVSSDGTHTYLATPGSACTCRAGHRGHTCRHTVAAALLSVA